MVNRYGWTPVNITADGGHIEVVKFLVDKGADITVAKKGGWTPVNNAAGNVVTLLVDKDADIAVANKDGRSPLLIPSTRGLTAVLALAWSGQLRLSVQI